MDGETRLNGLLEAVMLLRTFGRSPSEGEQKTREIVSPSEGGTGTVHGKTPLHGLLEAVMLLRTFGR